MAKIKFNLVKLEKEVILQVIEQDRKERINGRLAGKIVEVNNTKYCFIFGGHSYPEIRINNKKFFHLVVDWSILVMLYFLVELILYQKKLMLILILIQKEINSMMNF